MTSGRDDDRHGSASDPDLLTSEDLFGDMLDDAGRDRASGPAPVAKAAPVRKAPIKVKVGAPDPARRPSARAPGTPLSSPGGGGVLPDDVAALLDVFGGDAPAEETAEPAPGDEPSKRAARAHPAGGGMDALVEDLLNQKPVAPMSRAAAPKAVPAPVPVPVPAKPAARTATKFQAAAPRVTNVPEGGGIDLARLAESALGHAPAAAPNDDGASEVLADSPPAARPAAHETADPAAVEPSGPDAYGPYRLLERVAVGGMAEVFRAKRSGVEGFEKVVAVKRILSHLSDNKEFVDMFIHEAKVVAGLAHPNIVQIFDLGKIDRSYYIAMEYVHGRDLRTILKRAKDRGVKVPVELAAYIVSRVCAALEYAHRKRDEAGEPMRIVHRDVSPQNILLSFEGDVKLTDFGIAKAASKATITDKGALRGKLLYMSPEQAWGKPMDRRSDVFSLGICFYELLTGQKPFVGSSETSILDTVRECRVAPPTTIAPGIPPRIELVAMKALERDPEVRYQDAGEMHRDLERLLHEGAAPTPRDVTLFLESLFDEAERGASVSADWPEERPSAVHVGPDEAGKTKDTPAIKKLLKRFGIR